MKECPVCYKTLGSNKKDEVALECGHSFCLNCSKQWLFKERAMGTCPMCRKPTEYFDRPTRSRDKLDIFLKNVYIKIALYKLRWNRQGCQACILLSLSWALEDQILNKKEKWYRPSMRLALKGLRPILDWVQENSSHIGSKDNKLLEGAENCEAHRGKEDCQRVMRELLEFERSMALL